MWEKFYHGFLNKISSVITDYIGFCVQSVIPTKEIQIYPNNKMYITKDVKHVMNFSKIAFKKEDTKEIKHLENELKRTNREVKMVHKVKLEKAFKSNHYGKLYGIVNHTEIISGREKDRVCKSTE